MLIVSESVMMLLTKNYQNWSILVEATACQSWHVFLRHIVSVSLELSKMCSSESCEFTVQRTLR